MKTIEKVCFLGICFLMMVLQTAYGRTIPLDLRSRAPVRADRDRLSYAAGPHAAGPYAANDAADGTLRLNSLPAGAADVGEIREGDEFSLFLFDDVELDLTLKERMQTPLGGEAFLAEVSGAGDGVRSAVVLRTDEGLTIDIQDAAWNRVYKVVSTSEDVKVLEVEPAEGGGCGCDGIAFCDGAEDETGGDCEDGGVQAAAQFQSATCVDVLVAYDTGAAAYANAKRGGITNFAQVAVQKMNGALANTGLDSKFRFRLVGVCALDAEGTKVQTVLYAIKRNEDGWKEVKTVRETVGADVVTTLIDTGVAFGTTGIGWTLAEGTAPSSFAESAYNVCAIRAVDETHTMTHEVGHNLGCGHSDIQKSSPGPQLYGYSAGYYFTGTDGVKYHTIMAYDGEGPGGSEVPYFSSPNYKYMGVPVGDAQHDNTLTIAKTYAAASKWRAQKIPTTYDIVFEPQTGTVFEKTIEVSMATATKGAQIRYTLDGSEPGPRSLLYKGPITLTSSATVRAVLVVNGVCGFPYEARYVRSTFAEAIGLPECKWTMSTSPKWQIDAEDAYDEASVRVDLKKGNSTVWVQTTIEGPCTLSFRSQGGYVGRMEYSAILDTKTVFTIKNWGGLGMGWDYTPDKLSIPSGKHKVKVQAKFFGVSADGATSFWLDDFKLTIPQVTVTLNPNGGSLGGAADKLKVGKSRAIGTLPKPVREGYSFKGWFTNKSGGTKVTTKTKTSKSVTYYAQWTAKKYTVKLAKTGKGTVSGGGKKAYKSAVTLKAKPAKGYKFDGWYDGETLKSKKATWKTKVPLNGVTYTAVFTKK